MIKKILKNLYLNSNKHDYDEGHLGTLALETLFYNIFSPVNY